MNRLFTTKTFKAAMLVGTLDILAAIIQFYLETDKNPEPIFKFIASGIFGMDAFEPEKRAIMLMSGLLLHFLIAYVFTILFFWIGRSFPKIFEWKLETGIVYGVFIWAIMNLLITPLSNTPKLPMSFPGAMVSILILVLCIGLPLSFIASKETPGTE
ncbi:DUF1440 domain-containing protein [Flavobacterium sp.]